MERRSRQPAEPQFDPVFAERFLGHMRRMDERLGMSRALELSSIDAETLRIYLVMRYLRNEVANSGGTLTNSGFIEPIVALFHRFKGIKKPYEAALASAGRTYKEHLERHYQEEDRRPLRIQNAANALIALSSKRFISYTYWHPTPQVVAEWGNVWRERLATDQAPLEF